MANRNYVVLCSLALALCLSHVAMAEKAQRGITGIVNFDYDGPPLRAKVQRDANAPLLVRVSHEPKSTRYQVRFIGNVAGQYDLRDWLEHGDGSPIALNGPLLVDVESTLPKDPRSDLFDVDDFQPGFGGGYRLSLWLAALAWLAVPIAVVVRRILAKPKVVEIEQAPAPLSLIDQLRPIIDGAARRELTIGDKARLELLLLHYYREQLDKPGLDMASSIQALRTHPQAGPILNAVEQWLHAADSSARQDSIERVLQLLEPLGRSSAASARPALAGSHAS